MLFEFANNIKQLMRGKKMKINIKLNIPILIPFGMIFLVLGTQLIGEWGIMVYEKRLVFLLVILCSLLIGLSGQLNIQKSKQGVKK